MHRRERGSGRAVGQPVEDKTEGEIPRNSGGFVSDFSLAN